jgi:hypothetical protein
MLTTLVLTLDRRFARSCEASTPSVFVNPVLINRDNMIIAGHGRVEAARLLGMVEIPTIRIGNLTEDQVRVLIGKNHCFDCLKLLVYGERSTSFVSVVTVAALAG